MVKRDIVVIGASAGGLEACNQIFKRLPKDLPASVFVVIHLSPQAPSVLAKILGRSALMETKNPFDGEDIQAGKIYVAPANCHLLVKPGIVKLGRGPRENGSRPSIDVLFRTAAYAYGERVIGIIVSGALSDGTAGLMAVKAGGGIAIVQKPEDAAFSGMPKSAIEFVDVDYVLSLEDIAAEIIKLVTTPQEESIPSKLAQNSRETALKEFGTTGLREGMPGLLTGLTCPDCGGAIWEIAIERFKEFRCHIGHSFTPELMLREQSEVIDAEFWRCLRRLEENIELRKKLARWAREDGRATVANSQEEQAELAARQAEFIRQALHSDVSKLSDPEELL